MPGVNRSNSSPGTTRSKEHRHRITWTEMDSYHRGPLWFILIIFTLPHVTCCPSSCVCNSRGAVQCVGHNITDLPKQLPVNTYRLNLLNTNMNVIKERSLEKRDLMLRFSLTNSHLHTIHPLAFHVAPQLMSVKLSNNDLFVLPAQVFSPLTTLEQLLVDGNALETIAPETFDGLVTLQNLDLSRNRLTNLSSDVFDGLTNLTYLNLGKNSIKRLPPSIFRSLTQLRDLFLYYNELEVLEAQMFDELVHLKELKIHQNQIASLPPSVFWSLRNLKILTLSSNRLQSIPEKSFYNMPKLIQLTIYNNPLLSLPNQLMGHMPEMIELYIYNTNLTTVPGNLFANMSGLLRLNLHLNDKLSELPSDLFCCLPNIQKLSLKSNNLSYLQPQLFSKLSTLSELFLNENKLHNLTKDIFHGLGRLSTMNLQKNHLKTLPQDTFLSNELLNALSLSENPWECTCSIRGIVRWLRLNTDVVNDKENVVCHRPMHRLLRELVSLRDEEFTHCDAASYFPTPNVSHEPTQPFHSSVTSGQRSASTTPPPGAPLPTVTRQVITPATTQPAISTTNDFTSLSPSTSLHTTIAPPINESHLNYHASHVFYDVLVIEQGPEFVHHNHHRGWVYLWFLPSDPAWAGFLMFCHILLVTTGMFLILAALYGMYRLNKILEKLKAEWAHIEG